MARYKAQDRNSLLLPVVLSEQIVLGSFAFARNVQFIAISGDSQPSHTHIAKFVATLSAQIKPLFSQVLMTCDAQGLIRRDMFAIDGVKLPSNAIKECSDRLVRHPEDRSKLQKRLKLRHTVGMSAKILTTQSRSMHRALEARRKQVFLQPR